MGKKKVPPKPKRCDPTVATLEAIVKSEGVKPRRSLINKLLLFWVKSSSEAQARGVQIAIKTRSKDK